MDKTNRQIEYLQETIKAVSVIIPCKDEGTAIGATVLKVKQALEKTALDFEILVVDDGSGDDSQKEALTAGARVLVHPKNLGYGRSIMNGMEMARFPLIAIMDADGTYPLERLPELIEKAGSHDMVVGRRAFNRNNSSLTGQFFRRGLYLLLLYLTNVSALDFNSGFRVFRRQHTLPYRNLLCPTFSFTTSQTLIYLLNGRSVAFVPIAYSRRIGRSKVAYFKDALRTFSYVFLIANIFQAYRLSLLFILSGTFLNVAIAALASAGLVSAALQLGLHVAVSLFFVLCLLALVVQPLSQIKLASFDDSRGATKGSGA
ncbi:MAG: glycosyltransferase family 2 protein [Deltaproteobacteria bacterium]|nr:glycosyltransferase family 2 protein [Deltaproteobacteria bacterium]